MSEYGATAADLERRQTEERTRPMRTSNRLILTFSILVLVLAACGGTVGESPGASEQPASPTPSAAPSAPADAPSEAPGAIEPDGTITVVTDAIADGPGESISAALEAGRTEPTLVNGVFVSDVDGTLYLAEAISSTSPLTFEGAVLEVLNYPASAGEWDPENADVTGLQEADGILYFESHQLYGVVER
jgi:hypothetical protein